MRREKVKDLAAGAVLLGLGLVLLITSFSIPQGASLGLGPSFMPRLMSGVLVFFGVLIGLEGMNKKYPSEDGDEGKQEAGQEKDAKDTKAVVLSLALLLAYILLMKPVGFVLSTTGYIMAQILVFTHKTEAGKGAKAKLTYLTVSAASSVVIYLIFTKGFSLLLPAGILG